MKGISAFFNNLTIAQKLIITTVIVGNLLLVLILNYTSRVSYTVCGEIEGYSYSCSKKEWDIYLEEEKKINTTTIAQISSLVIAIPLFFLWKKTKVGKN
jgi:hypothetical protein